MLKPYKKRPMLVHAVRWEVGGLPPEGVYFDETEKAHAVNGENCRWKIEPGNWLVRGESGNHYVCPHEDFLKVYEPAD